MIIQGSNNPLLIEFGDDIDKLNAISIALIYHNREDKRRDNTIIKHWGLDDVVLDLEGKIITAPIELTESIHFPVGHYSVEMKWVLEPDNEVWFSEILHIDVTGRIDKTIL